MFIRTPNRIINTDNIVEILISPAHNGGWDEDEREYYSAKPLAVVVVTNAPGHEEAGVQDYGTARDVPAPYKIRMWGDEADEFMAALTVYGPLGAEAWAGGSS